MPDSPPKARADAGQRFAARRWPQREVLRLFDIHVVHGRSEFRGDGEKP